MPFPPFQQSGLMAHPVSYGLQVSCSGGSLPWCPVCHGHYYVPQSSMAPRTKLGIQREQDLVVTQSGGEKRIPPMITRATVRGGGALRRRKSGEAWGRASEAKGEEKTEDSHQKICPRGSRRLEILVNQYGISGCTKPHTSALTRNQNTKIFCLPFY